jgi:ribonuclease J
MITEQKVGMKRENIFVCDAGDVIEVMDGVAKKTGRVPVGGVMYDDSGAIVSEVVLKDRIHMSQEGMFVVVLTVQRGSGRLLTSPDIISRGFIYLRDSEELMGMIRAYIKQKAARAFSGKYDIEVIKKEIKDEVTHILYDQTRRTPIVIPVINEIGVSSSKPQQGNGNRQNTQQRPQNAQQNQNQGQRKPFMPAASSRKFPPRQVPDSEVQMPREREAPSY